MMSSIPPLESDFSYRRYSIITLTNEYSDLLVMHCYSKISPSRISDKCDIQLDIEVNSLEDKPISPSLIFGGQYMVNFDDEERNLILNTYTSMWEISRKETFRENGIETCKFTLTYHGYIPGE